LAGHKGTNLLLTHEQGSNLRKGLLLYLENIPFRTGTTLNGEIRFILLLVAAEGYPTIGACLHGDRSGVTVLEFQGKKQTNEPTSISLQQRRFLQLATLIM
jgi:hypothetical protein